MRLYEFRCQKCLTDFEDLVRSDQDTVACPQCGSTRVTRLLSAVRNQSARPDGASSLGSCAAPGGFS